MALAVRCEAELRQDRCLHVLEGISEEDRQCLHTDGERDYKYHCVKCGAWLKNANGVLLQSAVMERGKR